jgi:hypothetical protein
MRGGLSLDDGDDRRDVKRRSAGDDVKPLTLGRVVEFVGLVQ